MSKYIPEDWNVVGGGEYPGINTPCPENPSGYRAIILYGDKETSDHHDDGGIRGRTREEALFNARLIAAAPQMYAALRAIIGDDNPLSGEPGHIDLDVAIKMGRDAVSKTGEISHEHRTKTHAGALGRRGTRAQIYVHHIRIR